MPIVKRNEDKLFAGVQQPALAESIQPRKYAYPVQSNGADACRILVVDDDPNILMLVAKMVKRLGHHPTTAEDAMDALFNLAEAHYPLVITDYKMPFMNGCQLAERIKTQHCGTRVIIMTGHCEEEVANKLNRSSIVDGFLFKPFNLKTLKAKIEASVGLQDGAVRHANEFGG